MRLARLRKTVHLPVTYAEYRREPEAFDPMERRAERVRHALWHGRVCSALDHLTVLRHELDLWSTTHPGRALDALSTTIRAIDEFEGYVGGNRRGVLSSGAIDPKEAAASVSYMATKLASNWTRHGQAYFQGPILSRALKNVRS
jgi:hypothetical protein